MPDNSLNCAVSSARIRSWRGCSVVGQASRRPSSLRPSRLQSATAGADARPTPPITGPARAGPTLGGDLEALLPGPRLVHEDVVAAGAAVHEDGRTLIRNRYDAFDPNQHLAHDQFARTNLGVNWFYDGFTRVTVAYDIPRTDHALAGGGYDDPNDDLLTLQVQHKF